MQLVDGGRPRALQAAGARLAAQFDTYKPFPDLAVNGKHTLSENIADVAGLAAATTPTACRSTASRSRSTGYTGDQQFFIGFAQELARQGSRAALRQQIVTDGHAPDEYRAATVRNIDAWYRAFDVQPGQTLYLAPTARVRVW